MSINIYVGNLSFDANESELKGLFEEYGAVDTVKIISDQFTGRSRGFGFVEMQNREEGMRAITRTRFQGFRWSRAETK